MLWENEPAIYPRICRKNNGYFKAFEGQCLPDSEIKQQRHRHIVSLNTQSFKK